MKYYHFPLSLLVSGLLLTACVDKDYDLNDIDLTLGSDVDLAMPLISTNQIKLIDFVKGDFLDTTPISGQDGEVLYAYAETDEDLCVSIPVIMDGSVTYDANKPNITLPELPDFLRGDDVRLVLQNPIIIANIESDFPDGCNVTAEITITADNGQSFTVNNLKATGSGNKKICQYIASYEDKNIPASLLDPDYGIPQHITPATGSVRQMFANKIPEYFSIEVKRLTVDGVGPMPVEGPFDFVLSFKIYAPMQIGSSDFTLSYEAIEEGWSDEFNDNIRKMDIDELELTATMTNSLPIDATVTLTPIDDDGYDIDGLDIITVKAAAGKASPVKYILKSRKAGRTLRDFISGTNGAQQLDGMRVNTKLKANEDSKGKYLTDKAYATFTNLKLQAKGLFIYDAN